LFAPALATFTFWGWQLDHPAGGDFAAARHHHRQGVRRARMADRPADRGRLGRLRGGVLRHARNAQGQHIYVANWFFAAYIVTIAVLHIVNSAEVPSR
jgi:cytochrome c oxidase cbb3-type subunit 1